MKKYVLLAGVNGAGKSTLFSLISSLSEIEKINLDELAKNSEFFERTETFNLDLDVNVKLVRIQKWKYNPQVLGHNGMVDPISLICSFKNEEDECIQISIDEVQGEIDKWQIMMN